LYLISFVTLITLLFSIGTFTLLSEHSDFKAEQKKIGSFNSALGTYTNDNMRASLKGATYMVKEAAADKELVTKALLRTCSHLYVKALLYNCPNPRLPSTVWGFAGTVNNTGDLLPAWQGTTTSVFSCANIDAFGRGLIQRSIPVNFIQSKKYQYDFTEMGTKERTDPCGFTEIVDID